MRTARVVWKQYRFELGVIVLGALSTLVVWAIFAARLAGLDLSTDCASDPNAMARSACQPALLAARPVVASLGSLILEIMRVLPFAIGLLGGVPIVARELETRTAQTAWSLNPSRRRWLVRQASIVGLPILIAAVATGAVAASVESIRQATGDGGAVLNIGEYGLPAVARAVAAFSIGLLLGALLGRSVPALVLGAMLCLALAFALGGARDAWLSNQLAGPIPPGSTTYMTNGWAYQTPAGSLIPSGEAMAHVPPEIAAQDDGQVQPVNSGNWLDEHGYVLVPIGVSQEVALGWLPNDTLAFAVIAVLAGLGAAIVVDRRRPA